MAIERQHRPIDKEFEEADYTGVLDISGRKLRIFPNIGDEVFDSLEVFTAIVSGNRFDKLPKQIFKCLNLVTLNFHNNSLRSLPEEIASLHELKELNINRNFIEVLPASITTMKLQLLSVNNNRLSSLPSDIGQMKTLKSLDVSCNEIIELPSSLTDMSRLTYLNVRRNGIKSLPADLFKLPLTFLDVSANMLTCLPPSLRGMDTLNVFHCQDNPLEWPPAQICIRGINHVFKFLQEMEKYGSDPQQFAANRDESLLRRKKAKRLTRPTSDAFAIGGQRPDSYMDERSFVDEMTNFVHSAFSGSDSMFSSGPRVSGKYRPQYSYDDRSPYRHSRAREEHINSGRYRSQSPGPAAKIPTANSSQLGTHYGTLPRNTTRDTTKEPVEATLSDDSPYRRGKGYSSSSQNRTSSPDRALRAHSSEPNSVPPDLTHDKARSAKYSGQKLTPQSTSTPDQSVHRHELEDTPPQRPPTPPSREGSVTPTPEDLDTEEPLTPRENKTSYPRPTLSELMEDLSAVSNTEALAHHLNVSHSEGEEAEVMYTSWLDANPTSTWSDIIVVLRAMELRDLAKELDSKYRLSSFPVVSSHETASDVNKTPQHQFAVKQVSFSVDVSEIPTQTISVSSEEDILSNPEERAESLSPSSTAPPDDVIAEDNERGDSPISPSQTKKPMLPKTSPKPKPKDKDATWPKQKSTGGPQKRKKDVFKVIGKQDPNFTVRRQQANIQQELEKIQSVKRDMEDILEIELSDDLGESISDGVLLCRLVNTLYPNTISTVHVPKGTETLSAPKQTINVAAFIAACKKLGVPETIVCSAGEILEFKDPVRVVCCIRGLLDTASV